MQMTAAILQRRASAKHTSYHACSLTANSQLSTYWKQKTLSLIREGREMARKFVANLLLAGHTRAGAMSHTHNIGGLEAFRTFEQVELYKLAFVQTTIAIFLNRGEVNEHVFPGGPLDETITFGPIEPLHCTLLSHRTYSFRLSHELDPSPAPWSERLGLGAREVVALHSETTRKRRGS